MRLRVLCPTGTVVDEEVSSVSAEAPNGSFTLLSRHIAFATALTPGILSFRLSAPPEPGGPVYATGRAPEDQYVAVDEGILVKRGRMVQVSTRNAVRGRSLEELRVAVTERFEQLDEEERQARSALARLEFGFSRRYLELSRTR